MKRINFILFSVFGLFALVLVSNAQTITVTPFSFDQDLRVLQLEGKLPMDQSLNLRPISFSKKFTPDSLYKLIGGDGVDNFQETKIDFWKGRGKLALLTVTSITKYTSHHPFGWSDGALMPANGFQQLLTLGFYGNLGPLSLQIKPELLYAQDKPYETTWQFGPKSYRKNLSKYLPGQSRAALNIGALSLAVSTENIWWGPGQFSSLMISNHAPGFLHASLNTRRPIKTKIGSFEFQVIGGQLIDEILASDELYNFQNYNDRYGLGNGLEDVSKYLNAINIVYSPTFIQNLSVGFTRAYVSSSGNVIGKLKNELGIRKAFLPILDGFFKDKRNSFEDSLKWNQLVTFFLKMQFPKQSVEVYVEYGWNDHKFNTRDLMMAPSHSASYLVGAKKIVKLSQFKQIDFVIEYNQQAQQAEYLTRDAGSWYTHFQGSNLSNLGQILGSGIGFGSNALTVSTNIRKKYDQLGLVLGYVQQNPRAYSIYWNDYYLGIQTRKKVNSFLFNIHANAIFSKNYAWEQDKNRFNFMGMMGLSYFF